MSKPTEKSANHDSGTRLKKILDATEIFQTVNVTTTEGQVSVLGRIVSSRPHWMKVLKALKLAEAHIVGEEGFLRIMQDYFLKDVPEDRDSPDGKKIVYGWVVLLQSLDLPSALDRLAEVVVGTGPTSRLPPSGNSKRPWLRSENVKIGERGAVPDDMVIRTQQKDEEREIPLSGVKTSDRNAPKRGSQKGVTAVR